MGGRAPAPFFILRCAWRARHEGLYSISAAKKNPRIEYASIRGYPVFIRRNIRGLVFTTRKRASLSIQAGLLTLGSLYSPRLPIPHSLEYVSACPSIGQPSILCQAKSFEGSDQSSIQVSAGQWPCAVFVPDHSRGPVPDSHRVPFSALERCLPSMTACGLPGSLPSKST